MTAVLWAAFWGEWQRGISAYGTVFVYGSYAYRAALSSVLL